MTATVERAGPPARPALTGPRRGTPVRAARAYPAACWAAVGIFLAVAAALVVSIGVQSRAAWAQRGVSFLWDGRWDPTNGHYGAGLLVVGTLATTAAAMVLAVPIGVGTAIWLTELAPRRLAGTVAAGVEFLAAVPSIVVGLWALLVLEPPFARHVEPTLAHVTWLHWLFGTTAYGPGILLAAVVLATMTLPTVVALTRSALRSVDGPSREAAVALGATRWQVVRAAVVPGARQGITAAVTLAVGRALGESIAVALVIGNRPSIPHGLLGPGATLGSAIVNQFAEASPGEGTASIVALAAVLLVLTVAVNAAGVALLGGQRGRPRPAPGPPPTPGAAEGGHARLGEAGSPANAAAGSPATAAALGPDVAGVARRTFPRRRRANRAFEGVTTLAAAAALVPLVALVAYTVARGRHDLSWSLLTHAPTPEGVPGGGISTAITGTLRVIAIGVGLALPVGLLAALWAYDHRGRLAAAVRFVADVLTGVPSIVIGIFAYALLVEPMHRASDLAAGVALAVLMVPVMVRGNEAALLAVPADLWEAGTALGAWRSRVATRIVLRESAPGLVVANLLAVARALGETAPLLFTVAAPTAAMTLLIFDQGNQPYPDAQATAWATALVLLGGVLALSAVARIAAWRVTRHQR